MNEKIRKILNNEHGNYIFPFFWLHGELEETLREYMKVIYDSNIRAVCVESRPHPDFCGEQWWHDMDIILEEAKRLGMKVWILDDSHFPTGFANGAMADQPDGLCRQSICCRIYEPEAGTFSMSREEILHPDPFERSMIENYTMEKEPRSFDDDRLLALYAVRFDAGEGDKQDSTEKDKAEQKEKKVDLLPLIKDGKLEWEVPEGRWKIYVLHLSRNFGYHRSYINMMDRASCWVLLDAVYEPHYAHYKEYFGNVIEGFFSDEPELGNGHMYEMNDPFGTSNDYPWSPELERELQDRMGADYAQKMGLLWETEADPDETAEVRYAYMDAVTKLVREDFSMQVGSWCREHGVRYIGHLIEDDNHSTRTGSSLGHYFRGLAGQDMAGIDDIGGQVFPQGEEVSYNNGVFQHRNGEFYHYVLGKLGSSAAAIEPAKKGDSMCEIFGNYGWEEGVRLEKYLADHFLVRGINHFVPHAFSPKEFPDPDCPPHFYAHGHNPQYRHLGCLMAYMNRVCELNSGGRHAAPAAVIYHAEGDWTGKCMTDDRIAHCLADAQIEYDILPLDAFVEREEYRTKIGDGLLRVNTQEYRIVIAPYMQYVTKAFANAVCELAEKQVPVVFVGGYPEGICDEKSRESNRELIRKVREAAILVADRFEDLSGLQEGEQIREISLEPGDDRIRYRRYLHGDGTEVWMFVNEGTETYRGKIRFMPTAGDAVEKGVAYEYDAWENALRPVIREERTLVLELEPLKSRIFVFDPSATEEELEKCAKEDFMIPERSVQTGFEGPWKRSICESIRYPDFREEKEITLPDRLAEEEPEFSGFVRYENEFEADGTGKVWLEITDAYEGVEVFVNGESLGIQIVPSYRFDLTPAVKPGRNSLCIEVATTLERQMAKVPDQIGRTKEAKCSSGITGEVRLWNVR